MKGHTFFTFFISRSLSCLLKIPVGKSSSEWGLRGYGSKNHSDELNQTSNVVLPFLHSNWEHPRGRDRISWSIRQQLKRRQIILLWCAKKTDQMQSPQGIAYIRTSVEIDPMPCNGETSWIWNKVATTCAILTKTPSVLCPSRKRYIRSRKRKKRILK